jgi:putative ABC transport system substrate-binding protein
MRRRTFIAGLGGAAMWPMVARGQEQAMPVVAWIDLQSAARNNELQKLQSSFVQGLQAMGFVDHRNVIIDHYSATDLDQLPDIASNLVRKKVSLIVGPTNTIQIAKAATGTIPMVFIGATDPVAIGLVDSFNRPGGNVTGVRIVAGDLPSKQVELIHELVPEATKLGLLISPAFPNGEPEAALASTSANTLGLTSIVERVTSDNEFGPAFMRFRQNGANVVLVITNLFFGAYTDQLASLALAQGLPLFGQTRGWPLTGALASYGADSANIFREAGTYAGRILKGDKPADLPVVQPTKFDLVINLKTAKALGRTVSPSLLARADEVIE